MQESDTAPLDHLPEIGETVAVRSDWGSPWRSATVISMRDCMRASPHLWRLSRGAVAEARIAKEPDTYTPEDRIRAFRYADDGTCDFCIMHFPCDPRNPWNTNMRATVRRSPAT